MQPLIEQVQSASVSLAITRYVGIWWLRSWARPSATIPALIYAIDGNSIPRCDTGRVRMLVFVWLGSWGSGVLSHWFVGLRGLRYCPASLSLMGWMEIRAWHLVMMHCAIFSIRGLWVFRWSAWRIWNHQWNHVVPDITKPDCWPWCEGIPVLPRWEASCGMRLSTGLHQFVWCWMAFW